MLHDGHQFHVGKIHALDVFRQAGRGFAVSQRPVALFRDPHPRTQMHFVNGNRRLQRIPLCPWFPSTAYRPTGIPGPTPPRRCAEAFREECQTDRLSRPHVPDCGKRCGTCTARPCRLRAQSLPRCRNCARASQGMRLRVPAIKVADHGNRAGVRRPNSKVGARLSRGRGDVRAQLVVNPVVRAFVEEMEVLLGQQAGIAARGRR